MSQRSKSILIHLHIPKNAGTTLSRMLKVHLLLHPPTRIIHHESVLGFYTTKGHAEDRIRRIEGESDRARRRIRFFEAHCGYGVHTRLPSPSLYITTLRDPVDRALSVFYFRKQQGDLPEDYDIERWLLEHPDDPVWHVDNGQVRYLASDDGRIIDCPVGEVSREMLDKAKRRLEDEIAYFGLVERFDESVVLLRRVLGWRSLNYARSNVTRKRKSKSEISNNDRELLRRHTALDAELFAFARDLFQQRIEAEGTNFGAECARFTAQNARHARRFGAIYQLLPKARRAVQRMLRA